MALYLSMPFSCSMKCPAPEKSSTCRLFNSNSPQMGIRSRIQLHLDMYVNVISSWRCERIARHANMHTCVSKAVGLVVGNDDDSNDEDDDDSQDSGSGQKVGNDNNDDCPSLMSMEEREELRRKIRDVLDSVPEVEPETDPEKRKAKMKELFEEYQLIVEEEDPNWPEDADGWGFNFDQFFDTITINNVKKDDDKDDEGYDSDKEIEWQDDNYIGPIRDIKAKDWEDTVFINFNPLIILVHNRYRRPSANEKAREELVKAVEMFWDSGLPSPRCVAVDACVEHDLVEALHVSDFPEILFTKAGKILHRDKEVRSAEDWSKMMAFFYYKAARPPFLSKTAGQRLEKIPSLP